MSKYFFKSLAFVLLVSSLLTACQKDAPPFECTDAIGCVTIAPGEPLKLGVIQALTGEVAILGLGQIRGIELAMAKRDDQFLGHPIELQIEDEQCTAAGGSYAALKAITDPQVVALIGTTCSEAAKTASKIMSEAGLVMVSGYNSAPFLTSIGGRRGPDWQPGYFRTAANEETAGGVTAAFAFLELGVRKAATINDGDIHTQGLTDGFRQTFEKLGGEIVLYATINKGDADMQPILTAVRDSEAELLFFPLFQPEGDLIVLQARDVSGLEDVILMSDGVLITSAFIQAVGAQGVGMYFVVPAFPQGPASDALASEYESRFGESPLTNYYQSAYDAANLLLDALQAVAAQDANAEGTLHIGRQALRDALYATMDFEGVTGRLTCDEFGDCAFPRFNVVRLDDPEVGLEGLKSNVVYIYAPDK